MGRDIQHNTAGRYKFPPSLDTDSSGADTQRHTSSTLFVPAADALAGVLNARILSIINAKLT